MPQRDDDVRKLEELRSCGAPVGQREHERLAALRKYLLLDTPAESSFDRVTSLAQRLFNVPICLISLVDIERQWFKSAQGLDAAETARNISFCQYAVMDDAPSVFVVPNALEDERFRNNVLVTGPPHIRSYAGAAIFVENDLRIGTLCVIDREPRSFSLADKQNLLDLAFMASREIKLRLQHISSTIRERAQLLISVTQNARTPLSAIMLGLEHLMSVRATLCPSSSPAAAEDLKQTIDDMKDSVNALEMTVQSGISLGSMMVGNEVRLRGRCNPQQILQQAQAVTRGYAKHATLLWCCGEELDRDFITAGELLRQACLSYISNSCHFTKQGAKIRVHCIYDPRRRVIELSVEDTGCGVPEEKRASLFQQPTGVADMFNASPTGLQQGWGLFAVSQLCRLAGAQCGFRPNEPTGAVFWIRVRADPQDRTADDDGGSGRDSMPSYLDGAAESSVSVDEDKTTSNEGSPRMKAAEVGGDASDATTNSPRAGTGTAKVASASVGETPEPTGAQFDLFAAEQFAIDVAAVEDQRAQSSFEIAIDATTTPYLQQPQPSEPTDNLHDSRGPDRPPHAVSSSADTTKQVLNTTNRAESTEEPVAPAAEGTAAAADATAAERGGGGGAQYGGVPETPNTEAVRPTAAVGSGAHVTGVPGGSRSGRALVVDDSRMVRKMLVRILGKQGWEVEQAENGKEALRVLCTPDAEKSSFDLILMDFLMPVMDGIEATRRFREWESQHSPNANAAAAAAPAPAPEAIPADDVASAGADPSPAVVRDTRPTTVIGMSATATPDDIASGNECGMDGFLAKPVRMTDLAGMLHAPRI